MNSMGYQHPPPITNRVQFRNRSTWHCAVALHHMSLRSTSAWHGIMQSLHTMCCHTVSLHDARRPGVMESLCSMPRHACAVPLQNVASHDVTTWRHDIMRFLCTMHMTLRHVKSRSPCARRGTVWSISMTTWRHTVSLHSATQCKTTWSCAAQLHHVMSHGPSTRRRVTRFLCTTNDYMASCSPSAQRGIEQSISTTTRRCVVPLHHTMSHTPSGVVHVQLLCRTWRQAVYLHDDVASGTCAVPAYEVASLCLWARCGVAWSISMTTWQSLGSMWHRTVSLHDAWRGVMQLNRSTMQSLEDDDWHHFPRRNTSPNISSQVIYFHDVEGGEGALNCWSTRTQSESSPAPTTSGQSVSVSVKHKMSKIVHVFRNEWGDRHFWPFSAVL